MTSRRSQRLDSVRLMEHGIDLGVNQMRQSTLINVFGENVEDLVVLLARGYRSVVLFRESTIANLKMLKDDDEDNNLEAALDVVATHIKKEYARQTCPTKIFRYIADESAPDTLQKILGNCSLVSNVFPSLLIGSNISSVLQQQ